LTYKITYIGYDVNGTLISKVHVVTDLH